MRTFRLSFIPLILIITATARAESYDIVVYGGTSGGIIAAVQSARMGKKVVLIEPTKHLGGMTAGGLGATDMGDQAAIGGTAREFYRRVRDYYEGPAHWKSETLDAYQKRAHHVFPDAMFAFEPHMAELIFKQMLDESKVTVVLQQRLDLKIGVTKRGARITSITMEDGHHYEAKVFIDATYEGDLMAKAGVSYVIGREANKEYGETLDGIEVRQSKGHQFSLDVDPYLVSGKAQSGLIAGLHAGAPGADGDGDHRVQAYNYRLCFSDDPDNRVPFPKPAGYDAKNYEILLRLYDADYTAIPWNPVAMPNHKTDTNNNGPFSTDFIGMADAYPEANYAEREKIIAAHVQYDMGFLYTLANDPRVPEKVRKSVSKWGLAKDEFADNGNWPYQLYVREARRMVGQYVMTQADIQAKRKADDPVGLGSYGMDSHNCQRYVDESGHVRNEGDVQVHGFKPYGISYRSLIPKAEQCTNLLVPVCMSATHIAYGSIRMEPVYMILGQACGTAASIAVDDHSDVQNVNYEKLRKQLQADKQLLGKEN